MLGAALDKKLCLERP